MAKSTKKLASREPAKKPGKTKPKQHRTKKPEAAPLVLDRLWSIIERRKDADPETSHSARLMARGTSRIAQKLGEEAVECLIEFLREDRAGTIAESADLIYHLLTMWVHAGIEPHEVWQELTNRERASHLSEGAPGKRRGLFDKTSAGTTKIP